MKKTFLFYDLETSGLNPCFDQILQFAAIRTDTNLTELERYEYQIKLNNDIIPSPAAMIVHHIGISQCQQGISEFSATSQIHQLLNTPGTTSIGYNNLGFDDEFLRFSFFRNLLPAYSHQFAHDCSRMDLYPMTMMYYLFNPKILKTWPSKNQQVSLKLDRISAANELASGQAHTAMVDVEATLALARHFILDREMWNYLLSYFDKTLDSNRIHQLSGQEALLVEGKIGAINNYIAPVLHLGQHSVYKNQNLWLRLDYNNFSQLSEDHILENVFVFRKKIGEHGLLLPLKSRYLDKISNERQQIANNNKIWLQNHSDLLLNMSRYFQQYVYPKIPLIDADAALYEMGFPQDEDYLMKQFHNFNPEQRMQMTNRFSNQIRKQQILRIMGRHFFNYLSDDEKLNFNEYQQQSIYTTTEKAPVDFRGQSKLTLTTALTQAKDLQAGQLSDQQKNLLQEFIEYYERC